MEGHLPDSRKKWCLGCRAWLPLEDFHNCKSMAGGKRSRCKGCFKKQNAPHMRKYLYRLSDEELGTRWERQERCCAICRDPIPLHDRKISHVDLDPATREFRGFVCVKCNWGLGGFRDNQVLLLSAIKYLKRFEMERREMRRRSGINPI